MPCQPIPYALALQFCIERAVHFLRAEKQQDKLTHIIVECRGAQEDRDLELEFRRICDGKNIIGKIDRLDILFARRIDLKVLRPKQANRAYDVIEGKFRHNGSGKHVGYGFKVFP